MFSYSFISFIYFIRLFCFILFLFFYFFIIVRRPPSAVRHPPSAIRHPPSAIRHPPSLSAVRIRALQSPEDLYCSVSWNSPLGDYQVFDWRVNILIQMERFICRHSDYSKRPPVHAGSFSLLPPQSPRCFSVLARLYYVACPTKTMMPRR